MTIQAQTVQKLVETFNATPGDADFAEDFMAGQGKPRIGIELAIQEIRARRTAQGHETPDDFLPKGNVGGAWKVGENIVVYLNTIREMVAY